jgi:anaerobic selenocysteine-containing dehydrogenase
MGLEGFQFEKAAEVGEEMQAASSKLQVAGSKLQVASDREQGTGIGNPGSAINNPDFPFTLLVERNQFSYRGSALTGQVHGMAQYKSDEGAVMLNPADAAELGLQEGEPVRVTSEFGSDSLIVRITPDLPRNMVFSSTNAAYGSGVFPGNLPAVKAYAVKFERNANHHD